jgi:hypothetical protein
VITRIPGNPVTGRGGQVSEMGIAVEVIQVAFVVLAITITAYEAKSKRIDHEKEPDSR